MTSRAHVICRAGEVPTTPAVTPTDLVEPYDAVKMKSCFNLEESALKFSLMERLENVESRFVIPNACKAPQSFLAKGKPKPFRTNEDTPAKRRNFGPKSYRSLLELWLSWLSWKICSPDRGRADVRTEDGLRLHGSDGVDVVSDSRCIATEDHRLGTHVSASLVSGSGVGIGTIHIYMYFPRFTIHIRS